MAPHRGERACIPGPYLYLSGITQPDTEDILQRFALRLGAGVQWSTEVVGLEIDDDGVTVASQGPDGRAEQRVDYVVGCDGARSAVRRLAGIAFEGSDGQSVTLLGDVEVDDPQSSWRIYDRRETGAVT